MKKRIELGESNKREYSDSFKSAVITDLLQSGDDVAVVASRHGIGKVTLYKWLNTLDIKPPKQEVRMLMDKEKSALIEELAEAKREISRLKVERFQAEADALVQKTLLEHIEKKYHIDVKKKTDSK